MGAVEHLKTLCCLGLPPESAMVAVTPLLHEIIPHGASRTILLEPDATVSAAYAENPATYAIWLEHAWRFTNDRTSPMYLWMPLFHAVGIGWTLHLQGQNWLECGWFHEVEAPTDSCWILDAQVGDAGRTIAGIHLTRPRSARPFNVDDMQRLDRLRPWLAHAFHRHQSGKIPFGNDALTGSAGVPVLAGQIILTSGTTAIYETQGAEQLLRIIEGESRLDLRRYIPVRDRLPAPILRLLKCLNGAANGTSNTPPRLQISTPYGAVTLEAKWLVPANTIPADVAKDPKSCLISVTIELREHAIAHAARVLRDSGATPTQVKVGIQLALGKTKPMIADELGIKLSSVADQTNRLYQTLDIHNSTELSKIIWLGGRPSDLHQSRPPSLGYRGRHGFAS